MTERNMPCQGPDGSAPEEAARPRTHEGDAPFGAPPPPAPQQVHPLRLLLTLGGAGALAGFLIVAVYQTTLPAIEANRAAALAAAVEEVLGAPASFETLYLVDGALVDAIPEGVDPRRLERVYPGYREDGGLIGFALEGAKAGFQDLIHVIFGYDPATGTVLGMRVLRHMETPGLGDKIVTDQRWVAQFDDARPPLMETKPGQAEAANEIDMITGATISARTVVGAINETVERWNPILAAHQAGRPGTQRLVTVGGNDPVVPGRTP